MTPISFRPAAVATLGLTALFLSARPSHAQDPVNYNPDAPWVVYRGHDLVNPDTYSVAAGKTLSLFLASGYYHVTQSGAISGDGNVTIVTELGTITFTADNTYTGGTSIAAYSILRLGNGGTTGSIASAYVYMDRGFLRFDRSDDVVFSANINGTGEIRQQGAGTTILTGTVTLGSYIGAPLNLSGAITISSGALQIGNGGTSGSVDAVGIVNHATLIFNRSDAYTFSDPISGSGSVVQKGAGTLTLSGTNTYSGGTTVSAGLLAFSSLDNFGSGSITLNGGGLQWTTGNTADVSSRLTALGSAGATFDVGANNVTFASVLSGSGGLTKSGSGTLTLGATNTYTGGTAINAGLIGFSSLGNFGSGSITLNGGGLQWSSGNTTDVTASSQFNGTLGASGATFDTNGNNVTFANALSGTGGLIKSGAGTLTLAATNTYTGATTISGGVLQIGNASTSGSLSGSIVNNAALVFNRSDALTHSGLISGSGSVTQSGAGTLTLSGTNTYTGGTTLNAGTFGLGSNSAIGTGTLTINGGNLRAVGSQRTLTNSVVLNGDFTLGRLTNLSGDVTLTKNVTLTSANPDTSAATTSTLSGIISGNYGLTFTEGSNPIGTIILSGANTHTGNTVLNSGALTLANSLALQNSTFDYAGGTLSLGTLTNVTFGGLKGSQSLALTNPSSGAVALTVGGNNASTTYSGVLSGSGSLTKNGSGTLTLSGANTYSGGTTINAGLVAFSSLASFGSGALTFNGGGLQWASGNTADITSLVNTFGSSGITFDTGGNNVTFANGLSGSGALTKTGAGTLTLAATNTYTGATTVSGGTLALSGGDNRLATTGTLYLTGGGTLDLGGNSQTFASLGSSSNRLVGNITAGTIATTGYTYLQSGTYANTFTGSSATARLWIGGDSSATVTLNGTNDAVYAADHNQVIIGHSTSGAAGTVKLGHANALAAATENVEVWTGTLDLNGQTNVRANSITLADDHTSNLVNNSTASVASYAGTVFLNNDNYGGPGSGVGGNGQLTLSGDVIGTTLNKTGSGTLALANDSFFTSSAYPIVDYGRQVVLSGGTLSLGGNATELDFGDYYNMGVGAVFAFSNNSTLSFSTSGDATFTGGYFYDDGSYSGLRFETTGQNITLTDSILTGYSLYKTGAGTLTLASTGSGYYDFDYTGVGGGTLVLTEAGQLGHEGFSIGVGATLDLGGSTQTLSADFYSDMYSATLTGGTLSFVGELYVYGSSTLDATFTGSGNNARLWLDGASTDTVYLGGSNDRIYTSDHNQVIIGYSGAGTVKLLTSTALAAATENVEVWSGTLDLNGQTGVRANSLVLKSGSTSKLVNGDTANAASYAGAVTFSTGSAQLGGAGNLALSGVLSGAGGFTKIGAGTLTLSGANTYTGATTVSAGTLRVNGSLANTALTVASGATLGGSGTIGGVTTISSGGTLAPGNSPGLLTISNHLVLADGSVTLMELGGLDRGTGYDALDVTGSLTFGGTLEVTFYNGFTAAAGNSFDLFNWGSASGGFASLDLPTLTTGLSWDTSALYTTGTLSVSGSAIPEPSTYAALFGAAALGLVILRRRQSRSGL